MKLCQKQTLTYVNRYPLIFKKAKELLPRGELKILSFGCSSGAEVRTLKRLGHSERWDVHGADLNAEMLTLARKADPRGTYVADASTLPKEHYDAIFCMSVLCHYPSERPTVEFPHSAFHKTLSIIVSLLKSGGLLVAVNCQYDIRTSGLNLAPLFPIKINRAFVPMYNKQSQPLPKHVVATVPIFFLKRRRASDLRQDDDDDDDQTGVVAAFSN